MKPDFFDDEDLAELEFWIRLLYQGLWVNADKAGRLKDRPVRLKALIFPYDNVDVESGLLALAQPKKHSPSHPPFINRYSVDGENYIQIVNFLKHQSPHHTERESQIPAAFAPKDGVNGDLTVKGPLLKGYEQDAHLSLPYSIEGNREEKRRGEEEADPFWKEFTEIWNIYPKREAKIDSFNAYKALRRKKVSFEQIWEALRGYSNAIKIEKTYRNFDRPVMILATFLRKERWRDFIGVEYKTPL